MQVGPTGPALTAGVARIIITPPVGIYLMGYMGRPPSTGIHDDLTATALVLAERSPQGEDARPEERVALLALDVLGLPGGRYLRTIKDRITAATGIPAARILLCCSHSHYGPVLAEEREDADAVHEREGGQRPEALAYRETLAHQLAGLAAMAGAALHPVTLAVGRGSVRVGINRREWKDGKVILGQNPEGTLDSEVLVWRFDLADGPAVTPGAPGGWVRLAPEPVAVVVNYACHGTSLGSQERLISADFPDAMREVVERLVGGRALFVQGAAGDINPAVRFRPGDGEDQWAAPRRSGDALGAEVARAALVAEPAAALPLRLAREPLDLPPMLPETLEEGRARLAALEAEAERLARPDGNVGGRLRNAILHQRARRAVEALEGGPPVPPVCGDVVALRVGDTALVTNPSELFCEIGLAIKRGSPFAHTGVAGYTDGSVGYIPTHAAYPEGGYEVEHACRVSPAAGDMVRDTSLRLLRALR